MSGYRYSHDHVLASTSRGRHIFCSLDETRSTKWRVVSGICSNIDQKDVFILINTPVFILLINTPVFIFQFHRAFMLAALVLTTVGFILAFVASARNLTPGLINFCSQVW